MATKSVDVVIQKKLKLLAYFFFNHLDTSNIATKSILNNSFNPVARKIENYWFHSHETDNLITNSKINKYKNLLNDSLLNSSSFI